MTTYSENHAYWRGYRAGSHAARLAVEARDDWNKDSFSRGLLAGLALAMLAALAVAGVILFGF